MVNKAIKRTALLLGVYLAGMVAVNAHIAYDYHTHTKYTIENGEIPKVLEVHKYEINLDGEEEYLTIVAEKHSYSKEEYEIGIRLAEDHAHFASEVGTQSFYNVSKSNLRYLLAIVTCLGPSNYYYNLGSGRTYDSVSSIAEDQGYFIYALEDVQQSLEDFSGFDKALFFGWSTASALVSPIGYYQGRDDTGFVHGQNKGTLFNRLLVDKRDEGIADGIIDLLRDDEIDDLLASLGIAHFEGVIEHLSEKVELIEIPYDYDQ